MKVYVFDTETFEKDGVPHLRLLVWRELGKEIHHVDTFLEPKRAERVARELLKNAVVGTISHSTSLSSGGSSGRSSFRPTSGTR